MLTSTFVGLTVLFAINRPVTGQTLQDVTAAVGLTGLSGSNAAWGDYNNDGVFDNLDITPFNNLLNPTGSTATTVPDPSSIACGLLALMMPRKRPMTR